MKGKRHTAEEKIRILREADSGMNIIEVCRDRNISEVTFHRWNREFGMMDLNETKRLKELERENGELKKMLADSLLKNRVLEAINAKNGEPVAQAKDGRLRRGRRPVFRASSVPLPRSGPRDLSVSSETTDGAPVAVGGAHPRFGFRRIVALLRREGWSVSRKQVQRVRRTEGLRVPLPRKRQVRRGVSTGLPTRAMHRGHVWTWDFIADATVHGGALRMLTVLDGHTKEVHVLRPERRIGSADVIRLVQAAIAEHGAPEFIRSDNGPEFIARDLQQWLAEQEIKTIYITPASPWGNGFVESFHSRFRDECLNREQLWTLTEARVVIEDFRQDYNTERPHSSLGYDSPRRFAEKNTSPIPGSGLDRQAGPSLRLRLPTTPPSTTSPQVSD